MVRRRRAELIYVRTLLFWRCWAFGVVRSTTRKRYGATYLTPLRFGLVTLCFGPLRVQFLDWGSRHG